MSLKRWLLLSIFWIAILLMAMNGIAKGNPSCHIVKKGDTLAQIAGKHFGDWRKWPILADLNQLKVLENDIVIIQPGQKIWLTEPLTAKDKTGMALKVARVEMERVFKIKHGRRYKEEYPARAWALKPLELINEGMPTPEVLSLLKETRIRMAWQDMTEIHRSIKKEARTADDILVLASMARHESDFRNIEGEHGEIGPMQVMPATGFRVLRGYPDFQYSTPSLPEDVADALWDIPTNIRVAWDHFKGLLGKTGGDVRKALRKYNGHGEPTVVYADRVTKKLRRLERRYNSAIRAEIRARLSQTGSGQAFLSPSVGE